MAAPSPRAFASTPRPSLRGAYYLPADASWRDDFISEFVEFPHGQFTDQVDATTQFLDHASEFMNLKPPAAAGVARSALNSSGLQDVVV